MKKAAKILLAMVLLLAGSGLADMNPMGLICRPIFGDNVNDVACDIAQGATEAELSAKGYIPYTTWAAFSSDLISEIQNQTALATGSVYINFDTDIDLGGYSETEKKCVNEDFSPIDFSQVSATGRISINGGYKTIKGFCYIVEDEDASFFRSLKNVDMFDLTFDDAYVMAKTVSANVPPSAAVVVNVSENTAFNNVNITNSKVYGWNAAGIVYWAKGESKFSDIQIDDVFLSLSEESAENISQITGIYSRAAYYGGVVADLSGYANVERVSVSNLVVPDSTAQILLRANLDYTGASYVGGIFGLTTVTTDAGQANFSLQDCNVSAELSGSTVGGLIGAVSPYDIPYTSTFEVTNSTVTLKSGDYNGANQNRYVGGLVGSLAWKNGNAELSKNKVEVSVNNKKTGVGSAGSNLGGLLGAFSGLQGASESLVNLSIDENEVAAEISTSERFLYLGGVAGYMSFNTDNSVLSIKNTTVKPINPEVNSDVITASATNLNSIKAAYGVGRVLNSNGTIEILENHAEGNINIVSTSVVTESAVGVMLGLADVFVLDVHNNTSIGDLQTSIVNGALGSTSGNFSIGYEAGAIWVSNNSASVNIEGNYHYGSSDVNAKLAVGLLGLSANVNDEVSSDLWKTQAVDYYRVWKNYRNAVTDGSSSLDAEGTLDIDGTGAIYAENENKWLYDGVVDGDAMKSRLFAYVLNGFSAGSKDCDEIDAICWENGVDSLPVISEKRTVYKVVIDLDDIYDKLTDADKDSLKDYMVATRNGSHSIVSYSESYGTPNYDFTSRVYGLGVIYGLFENNSAVASSVDVEVEPYNLYMTSDYYLKAKELPYENVYLDVNTDADEIFYGVGSDISDSLVVPNSIKFISLPSQIYTATSCVVGWSFVKDTSDYEYNTYYESNAIYNNINTEKTLYAVWWDADQCANGHYAKVALNSKNGTIAVDEYRGDAKVYSHHFAEDSTMLLSVGMYTDSVAMLVHAEPDSGYKFDSLVVVDSYDTVLFNGDTLWDYFLRGAVFMAYFSEAPVEIDTTEEKQPEKNPLDSTKLFLVRHEFTQSGNAVRMVLETNNFDAHRPAQLKVALMDAQGDVLEEPWIVKSIKKTPYSDVWTKYPLKPGKYTVKVMLYDNKETVAFDTSFVVNAEIAAKPDTWKMVSLSDVEVESIGDDDDQLLYWWDESALYGEFWKYQKYLGGESNPEKGYWYSSMEGRPLMLQDDSPESGNEIVWALDSGWNMVANPYGWFVDISELDKENLDVWSWDELAADYKDTTLLAPYEAIWIRSDRKTELRFEAVPEFEKLGGTFLKQRALAKAWSREDWNLQLTLSDARGHRDSWNVLGVGEAEERPEPPMGMGDLVRLAVVNGKRVLAKSVVPVGKANEYSWEVALSASSDRVGYLKFDGVEALNGMGLKVYVTVDGETAEIVAGDSLKVMLKSAGSTATVRVSSADIRTVALKLENLRFERISGALQVGFDVTEGLAGSLYRVQLVGLNGQVAASYSGKSAMGRNTLALTAPKPGLYLLRVTVGGQHAVRKVVVH